MDCLKELRKERFDVVAFAELGYRCRGKIKKQGASGEEK